MVSSAARLRLVASIALLASVACGGDGTSDDPTTTTSTGGGSTGAAGSGAAASSSGGGSAGSGSDRTTGGTGPSATTATLSVDLNGDGKVVSTPAGIECGSTCQGTFAVGTQVQLRATERGGVLTGWGEGCSGASTCTVTLTADTQVSATFAPIALGGTAHGVAVTPDGTKALVTIAEATGTLKLVSLADFSILDSITVGTYPSAVAVTPDGTKAAVTNTHDVSLVTLATRSVATVASPCAGDTLYDIAITPNGANAITTMLDGSCVNSSLAVIAVGSASMADQFTIPVDGTQGIALTQDGDSALLSRGILGTKVSRVAIAGGAITDITNTSSSFGIAVTPDGSEALIASGDGDTIKRVSLASNAVTGSIDYASNQDPHNIAVTPDGTLAVAVGSFNVGVLSLTTGTVLQTFSGGGRSVAITPDGKRALVTLGSNLRVFALQP